MILNSTSHNYSMYISSASLFSGATASQTCNRQWAQIMAAVDDKINSSGDPCQYF